MTATVKHHERVQVVAGPHTMPPLMPFTQGYTAWCDDERCASRDEEGRIVVMWRGSTHLVGYEFAPAAEAMIDAELHNEAEHPSSPDSGEGDRG